MTPRNIICMKWGTKFGPHYVNRLFRMTQNHLSLPHRFICFTDDAEGIDEGVEIMPLPDVTFKKGPERGWNKLGVLTERLGDLEGQALFLDLDVLIIGSLDDFFTPEGEFFIIKDWDFNNYVGNSSVFRFDIGKHADVLQNFEENEHAIRKSFRNEQAYLSHAMLEKKILNYWDKSWCVSFKRHCLRPFPLNWFMEPKRPQDVKVLIFHGHPHPEEACKGYTAKLGWRRIKPTKWINDYWDV